MTDIEEVREWLVKMNGHHDLHDRLEFPERMLELMPKILADAEKARAHEPDRAQDAGG